MNIKFEIYFLMSIEEIHEVRSLLDFSFFLSLLYIDLSLSLDPLKKFFGLFRLHLTIVNKGQKIKQFNTNCNLVKTKSQITASFQKERFKKRECFAIAIIQIKMSKNEVQSLRQYIFALEHQNRSKGLEQQVLHRELENLNNQLAEMEQYYFQNRELIKKIDFLEGAIQLKDEEISRLTELIEDIEQKTKRNITLENWLQEEKQITKELQADLKLVSEREAKLKQILQIQKTMCCQQKVKMPQKQENNSELRLLLQNREEELADLKVKLNKCEVTNTSETPSAERSEYVTLMKRYEQLEQQSEEREEKLKEMEDYIEELEYCCESLNNNIKTKEIELKQLKIQLNYLEKHYKNGVNPIRRQSKDRFYRSQVSTPQWKGSRGLQRVPSTDRSLDEENQKQNYSVILRAPSDIGDESDRQSVKSMNEQANRLQRRNSILKRQNEMLLKGMVI